jgi:HD-like signal output (HDOD) protein
LCAVLVERWGFPANLVNAIRYQHAPALGNTGLVAALYVANQLAKNLVEGDPLDVPALPEVVEQLLGKDLAAILVELDDLDGILQDARTFAAER